MSLIPLTGNEILVRTPESADYIGPDVDAQAPGQALCAWVMQRTTLWENVRERGYARLWANYWRLWRGKWDALDQTRQSERSRVITPALAQAIEASVAEVQEAIFAREAWVDVDASNGSELTTAYMLRDQILEDMEAVNVKGAVDEATLNAAIFGTGIVQINVETARENKPRRNPKTQALEPSRRKKTIVSVEAIRPDEFIPDPAATRVDQMLGMAVKRVKPQHFVLEMIERGIYEQSALPYAFPQHRLLNRDIDKEVDPQSQITVVDSDEVEITEWHGKVPLGLLNDAINPPEGDTDRQLFAPADESQGGSTDDEQLVEAIVTVLNGHVLLRARRNPFVMGDRSIIAFQWETVPGRFWGRGVAEKGYNPQIALDAAVRAYIDALGFISAPMLGIDSGRIPKGFKNAVYPGKVWITQGNPSEVLQTVQIGKFEPAMFEQASEMERMLQMGTGAFDTATALNQQSQSGANSMSANSMLMGAYVKRAKRVVQNVDRHLLTPLVTKILWRYMQYDPVRYPTDFDFVIKATMGIVAREAENMQLTQLVGMMPDEFHQAKLAVAKGIVENTSVSNKHEIMALVDQALKPNPQAQQQAQQAQQMQLQNLHAETEGRILENQLIAAQIKDTDAKTQKTMHEVATSVAELQQEQQRLRQGLIELENQQMQTHISALKIPIERMKAQAALVAAHKKPSGGTTGGAKKK